jgi:hypothetical protein
MASQHIKTKIKHRLCVYFYNNCSTLILIQYLKEYPEKLTDQSLTKLYHIMMYRNGVLTTPVANMHSGDHVDGVSVAACSKIKRNLNTIIIREQQGFNQNQDTVS